MATTKRMKKLASDPKDRAIANHAFQAMAKFFENLSSTYGSLERGYGVWEEEAKALVDSAFAALPFIDPEIRSHLEDTLRPLEALDVLCERGVVNEHQVKRQYRDAVVLIVDASMGLPEKYVDAQKKERDEEVRRNAEYEAKCKAEREEREKREAEEAAAKAAEEQTS